ncbi:MAG: DegV family protein [Chloroflexota bacterium]
MKVVTDNGIDISPQQLEGLDVEIVALTITMGDDHYKGGVDIQSEEFYRILRSSDIFPVTSQPSPADFRERFLKIAETDKDIVSIHMSSKISGTYNSARLAAEELNASGQANVTVIDSKQASGALGWIVEAAARAAKAGWSHEQIVELINKIGPSCNLMFSPDTVKYLVHGGRVSHIRGMAASVLNIKPILEVQFGSGTIESVSTVRTMKKALAKQVDLIEDRYNANTKMRVQIEHADNTEMAAYLKEQMGNRFDCTFLPTTSVTPLIGAHTGPGVVAMVYGPVDAFADIPG